ncbi:MAG: GNAT family N-acetyltransferase [Gammaproteobacteria bacterium]
MSEVSELETKRLKLRQWIRDDYKVFAAINADPEVMKFFPSILSEEESDSFARKIDFLMKKMGWGFWAVELKNKSSFIGFVGLRQQEVELPFSPCVEIGWRLSKDHWGFGYATEAAQAVLKFAFEVLRLNEVVSFTSLKNKRSQAVMEKLNMVNTGQNFEHPGVSVGDPLREHVLYKITKAQWENAL